MSDAKAIAENLKLALDQLDNHDISVAKRYILIAKQYAADIAKRQEEVIL